MITTEKLLKEIPASGLSKMDEEILLWYLSICKTASQWNAFTGMSWKDGRRQWYATDRLVKLSRGIRNG